MQYQNTGGKFTVPSGTPLKYTYTYQYLTYWTTDTVNKMEYTGTDYVTEDVTAYAVGTAKYGKSNIEKLVSTTIGTAVTQDLSAFVKYPSGISTAEKFDYSISSGNDNNCFSIDGDILTVSDNTPAGTHTLEITAAEKEPVITLMSADYGTEPFTFNVTVTVNKLDPEYEIPENLTAYYGQSLNDITLPEGFSWKDGTQSVGDTGVNIFEAIYTPEDSEHYNIMNVNIALTVNPVQEEKPAVTIDYENELLKGLDIGYEYVINGSEIASSEDGTLDICKYIGQTILVVKKASDANHTDSDALEIAIPTRPSAPTDFEVTQPSDVMEIVGSIEGITTEMEYSTDHGETWTDGTGDDIDNIKGGTTYTIRTKATADSFKSMAYVISINAVEPEQEQTPEISIDFINEQLTGFYTDAVYLINGELLTDDDGKTAIKDEYIGQTISIVRIGWINSEPQMLAIPARPSAPTDFEVTQPSNILGISGGSIGGITTDMEYSTDYGKAWTDGTGDVINDIKGGTTYTIRTKATANSFKSMVRVISINALEPGKESSPEISIDFINEQLKGFDTDAVYLINGELLTAEGEEGITANMPIKDEYIGRTVSIVRIGWINSEAQMLEIPARPAVPSVTSVNETKKDVSDGKITGVDSTMEYKTADGEWTDVTGTEITELSRGTYDVRVKATDNSFVSGAVTAEVGTDTAMVIFIDYNCSVLQAEQLEKGTMPTYKGDTPSKLQDDKYSYEFSGWSPEVAEVSDMAVYMAQYTSVLRKYGIVYSEPKAVVYVPEDTDCTAIFAAYDTDGALINIQSEIVTLEAGTSIVTPDGFDADGAASVKVMLWSSLDDMKPLCNSGIKLLQ